MPTRPLLSLVMLATPLIFCGVARSADPSRLPETVSRIERETGGRVLSAQRSQREGREVNRIKVYTPEGRVRVMWDDPQHERREMLRRGDRNPRPAVNAARQAIIEREASAARDDD